jgi:type IX secretion system PorP/SprF family membrane protein
MIMRLRYRILIAGLIFSAVAVKGQDTWYGSVSGIQLMYNPAWSGTSGVSALNVSAYSFLPGNGFGLKSVYASYDGFIPALHGGTGVWIADDILGEVMNDFRGGASYSYHFRAGRDLYITAGLAASIVSRGVNTGSVILPGDIDPFSGITGGSTGYISPGSIFRFDLGTGATFAYGPWYGGVSVMHLTQPPLSNDSQEYNRLKRLYTLIAGAYFNPGERHLILKPSAALLVQGDCLTSYLGIEAGYKGLLPGLSFWHVKDGFTAAETSLGWDAGLVKIILSYSYILAGGDISFNGTAIVKSSLLFSFNNVEKRKVPHIINLPVL